MDSRNHCALFGFKSTVNTYIQKKIRIILIQMSVPSKKFGDYAFFSWNPRISLWHLFFPMYNSCRLFFVLPLIPFSFFHYKNSELKISANNKWNWISNSIPVFHEFFLVAYGKNSWHPFSRNFCTILPIFISL